MFEGKLRRFYLHISFLIRSSFHRAKETATHHFPLFIFLYVFIVNDKTCTDLTFRIVELDVIYIIHTTMPLPDTRLQCSLFLKSDGASFSIRNSLLATVANDDGGTGNAIHGKRCEKLLLNSFCCASYIFIMIGFVDLRLPKRYAPLLDS